MPVITAIDATQATGKAKNLLDGVKAKLQIVPNIFSTMANAPAALEGYLNFSGALASGVLSAKVREQIALTTAQANSCEYCLAAHSAIGKKLGLSPSEISTSREATANDTKTDAILKLAHSIVKHQGRVSESEIAKAREIGITDAEIIEIIANVALNIFTNYFNHIAGTEVDFPKVSIQQA